MERIGNYIQKFLDNLQARPWVVFLFLALCWGSIGWYKYVDLVLIMIKQNEISKAELKAATDDTIESQNKTITVQHDMIFMLYNKNDSTK